MNPRSIDRFIDALHREGADALLFETGRAVRLRSGTSERNLLAQSVRTHQIDSLVSEAVPIEHLARFRQDGEVTFPYRSPHGPVTVRCYRRGNHVSVDVQPQRLHQTLVKPIAVGAEDLVLETPFEEVITRSSHPFSVVPGQRGDLPPVPTIHGTPVPGLMRSQYESEAPIELDMESSPPVRLPSEAVRPVYQGERHGRSDPVAPIPRARPLLQSVPPPPPTKPSVAAVSVAAVEAASAPRAGPPRVDRILRALTEGGGSDLHLTAGMRAVMRKDGDIVDLAGFPDSFSSETIAAWLLEIAPEQAKTKFDAECDADYSHDIAGFARFRVNLFRDRSGVGAVFRTIPMVIPTAKELGLPPAVMGLCDIENGLVTVTGPTGAGKSTTLAAMVDHINRTRCDHIITIEDPIEFIHVPKKCLVNQREVHTHTRSFSTALRAALREAPDVVLVGEMRDLETISIALETAETGHLVFGTLHTNTAVSTIDRIIDQFPSDRQAQVRVMLSESLRGVVTQMLCKRKGGGRVAALEVLLGIPAVANLIREGKTFQIASIIQTSRNIGMQSMNDGLMRLVKENLVEPIDAYRKAVNKTDLRALLERAGFSLE